MLIGVIAAIWVLKSERVLISESIEATPINHATCEHIHARGATTYVARTFVATKLWQCARAQSLIYSLQGYSNKECLFVSKNDGSAMGAYLSVGA